jgi:hypothetical protein
MLHMKKELLISLPDVSSIVIECQGCHSQLRVKVGVQIKPRLDGSPLAACSICGDKFDSTLPMSIENLRESFVALAKYSSVSLQVEEDELLSKQ